MKIIGLTGGIGSGKTTVASIFSTLGIPVYNSDLRAKLLMNSKAELQKQIIQLFGHQVYDDHMQLNTSLIASTVFKDRSQLLKLNSVVHPAVQADLKEWASQINQFHVPYLIQESAILFEETLTEKLNEIILIVAPEEIRISRVMERDKISADKVKERIKNQWTDLKKIPLADFIIFNDGERSLIDQVKDIDQMIRSNKA